MQTPFLKERNSYDSVDLIASLSGMWEENYIANFPTCSSIADFNCPNNQMKSPEVGNLLGA